MKTSGGVTLERASQHTYTQDSRLKAQPLNRLFGSHCIVRVLPLEVFIQCREFVDCKGKVEELKSQCWTMEQFVCVCINKCHGSVMHLLGPLLCSQLSLVSFGSYRYRKKEVMLVGFLSLSSISIKGVWSETSKLRKLFLLISVFFHTPKAKALNKEIK